MIGAAVGGVLEIGPWLEQEFLSPPVAGVAEDPFPRTVVLDPTILVLPPLSNDPRSVIQKMLNLDLRLERIAERLGPGDESECGIVETELFRKSSPLAFLGND